MQNHTKLQEQEHMYVPCLSVLLILLLLFLEDFLWSANSGTVKVQGWRKARLTTEWSISCSWVDCPHEKFHYKEGIQSNLDHRHAGMLPCIFVEIHHVDNRPEIRKVDQIHRKYGCKLDHFSRFLELLLFPWHHNSLCPLALHPTCMLVFSFFFYSSEGIPSHEINRLAADLLQWTASHKVSQAEVIPIPSLWICLKFMAVLASHVVKLLKCCSKQTWEHLKHDVQNFRTRGQLYLWLQFQE